MLRGRSRVLRITCCIFLRNNAGVASAAGGQAAGTPFPQSMVMSKK